MKIKTAFLQISLIICIGTLGMQCNSSEAEHEVSTTDKDEYQCIPCGLECDKDVYNEPGVCPHCQMQLVKKSTIHFKTIQPSEICRYISDHPDVVLLDVRTKEEFEGTANPDFGTLKNAINLPVQELESRLSTLDSLKEKDIIVYCSHSHRSPRASYILTQNGFKNITNMAGGMSVMNDNSCKK
ncbi:MAG: rhodanese-like domain-containing protein [Bacteroidia bacterium]|nr:rhodanese-like domain-containing protein [Bacteroidia bacterium]